MAYLVVLSITIEVERPGARALARRARDAEAAAVLTPGVRYADALLRPVHSGPSIEMRVEVDAADELEASRIADEVRLALHRSVVSRITTRVSFGWPLKLD